MGLSKAHTKRVLQLTGKGSIAVHDSRECKASPRKIWPGKKLLKVDQRKNQEVGHS